MMPHKEELAAPGFLERIATISNKNASGRLSIVAGTTDGAFLFDKGKLVEAHLGHLTGFQAINAVAAMPDAHFDFDPSVAVPRSSSISVSERLVLKQFFGIEAADANDQPAPVIVDQEDEEATLVTTNATSAWTRTPQRHRRRSRVPYLVAFAAGVLVIAVTAGAVLLRNSVTAPNAAPAPVAAADTPTTGAPTAEAIAKETAKPAATVPDLNGKWNVVNTVNNTSYQSFQNLRIGFALSVNQTGTKFTAEGRKVSENGRSLPEESRTPIRLQGFIDGDRIEATFSEQGVTRRTNGRFVWKIDRAGGALTGTFASTAAKTSGKSTAKRDL